MKDRSAGLKTAMGTGGVKLGGGTVGGRSCARGVSRRGGRRGARGGKGGISKN